MNAWGAGIAAIGAVIAIIGVLFVTDNQRISRALLVAGVITLATGLYLL